MQRRLMENKRSIAIIIALAILLLSALSSLLVDRIQNNFLDSNFQSKDLSNYLLPSTEEELILAGSDKENRIAVLPIKGIIETNSSPVSAELSVVDQLDRIIEDQSVKALLLNIDSPGGTVYESARILQKIKELIEERNIPVYSSMESVAASGGYYVAAPSDKIFAAEETITGSIGVIADYVNISELEEKIGIQHEVIKSGKFKDIGSMSREMTDEERAINQKQVDEFYQDFVQIIVEGRDMEEKEVLTLADGRIYTGQQALSNGLIDELGYFDQALESLIADLNLEDPEVYQYIDSQSRWNQLLSMVGQGLDQKKGKTVDQFESDAFKYIEKNRTENSHPQFYYLYGGF